MVRHKLNFVKQLQSPLTQYTVVQDNAPTTDRAGVTPGTHATVGGKGPALRSGYGKLSRAYGVAADCRDDGGE